MPKIAVSNSFVRPRGVVTLHIRIQLLAVLLLLRCFCEAATLFNLFFRPEDCSGDENQCWRPFFWGPPSDGGRWRARSLHHETYFIYQVCGNVSGLGAEEQEIVHDLEATLGITRVASRVSTALLFYLFIFIADGQGFLTFLLFALDPPGRQMGEEDRGAEAAIGSGRAAAGGRGKLAPAGFGGAERSDSPAMLRCCGVPTAAHSPLLGVGVDKATLQRPTARLKDPLSLI
jgi:hypothetical protein